MNKTSPPTFSAPQTAPAVPDDLVDEESYEGHTRRIAVTPELARKWLDRYDDSSGNVYNRTPGVVHVAKLARDMSKGHWKDTGVPIIFGTNDKVLDGRQRLEAVVLSGQTIVFDVRFGVDPDAQSAMDRPRKRKFADDLQMKGVPNAPNIAATATLVMHWRSGRILDRREIPTDAELDEFEALYRDELQLASRQAGRIANRLPNIIRTITAATSFESYLLDEDACMKFFTLLATGERLADGDPILALRNSIMRYHRTRPRRHEQLYHVVYAWNLWRANRRAEMLRLPRTLSSETFPTMK